MLSKGLLRARARAWRSALSPRARAHAAREIAARVVETPEWIAAHTVLLFASMGEEVETSPIFGVARAEGKRVAFPRVERRGRPLVFHARERWPDQVSRFGVLEPEPDDPIVHPWEADLVVVPLLAVDSAGFRLGYGGGFYDRTLALCPEVATIGVGYDGQRATELPRESFDRPIRALATERALYRFPR